MLNPYHQYGIFLELEKGKITNAQFYDLLRQNAGKYISDEILRNAMFGFVHDMPLYK